MKARGALTVVAALALVALVAAGGVAAWPRFERKRALARALEAARSGDIDARAALLQFEEPEAALALIDEAAVPRSTSPVLLPATAGCFVVTARSHDAMSPVNVPVNTNAIPFIEAVELAAIGDDATRARVREGLERLARVPDLDARWCALYGLLELESPGLPRVPDELAAGRVRLSRDDTFASACAALTAVIGRRVRIEGDGHYNLSGDLECGAWRALLIVTVRHQLVIRLSPAEIVLAREYRFPRSQTKCFGFTGPGARGQVYAPFPDDGARPEPPRIAKLLAEIAGKKLSGAELVTKTPEVTGGDAIKALRALARLNGCELEEKDGELRIVGKR